MEINYATTNKGKVASLRSVLSKYGIEVIHEEMDIEEPRTEDLVAIAAHKVYAAYEKIRKPVVVLDSGFYIHAFKGFPKTYVKLALSTLEIRGILKLVDGESRECKFRNCLAYLDGTLDGPIYF